MRSLIGDRFLKRFAGGLLRRRRQPAPVVPAQQEAEAEGIDESGSCEIQDICRRRGEAVNSMEADKVNRVNRHMD